MSATGLDVFDKTLQTTNSWLDEISQTLGPDRKLAWKVLSIVLHKLRDRIPVDLSAHLGAELPLLVRGTYYGSVRAVEAAKRLGFGPLRRRGREGTFRRAASQPEKGDPGCVFSSLPPCPTRPDREGAARVARGLARVVDLGRGKGGPAARARGTRPLSSLKPCTFRAGSNPTRSLTRAG